MKFYNWFLLLFNHLRNLLSFLVSLVKLIFIWKENYPFCLWYYSLFFIGCTDKDDELITNPPADNIADSTFCDFVLQGNYTVEVTKTTNNTIRVFDNEDISFISNGSFKTTTTAFYTLEQMTDATHAGFYFNIDCDTGKITVPLQNLAEVYTNQVQGFPENNGIDGFVIDENKFEINYEVTHVLQVPYYRYKAIYTRN